MIQGDSQQNFQVGSGILSKIRDSLDTSQWHIKEEIDSSEILTLSKENVSNLPSCFVNDELGNPISLVLLAAEYENDSFRRKINLAAEAFHSDDGSPWLLPVVKYVETFKASDSLLDHEYLPTFGLPAFCDAALEFCLGKRSKAIIENRAGSLQSVSGTGAMRLAADFLFKFYNKQNSITTVLVSEPANIAGVFDSNHIGIFKDAGFADIRQYQYLDEETQQLNLPGMLFDLKSAPRSSIVIFHACAHNPTGVDPTHAMWEAIAEVCRENSLFPVFDGSYLGFASGDPDADAWSIRYFEQCEFEMFVCQPFSHLFGLYNEKMLSVMSQSGHYENLQRSDPSGSYSLVMFDRCLSTGKDFADAVIFENDDRAASLIFVVRDAFVKMKCRSQLELLAETTYLNPPCYGARLVATILLNKALYSEWRQNLKVMVNRIKEMRELLYVKLRIAGVPGYWDHIINQSGLFSCIGLSGNQVEYLIKKRHIYLLPSGRINVCGLTHANVDYFVQCFGEVVRYIDDRINRTAIIM